MDLLKPSTRTLDDKVLSITGIFGIKILLSAIVSFLYFQLWGNPMVTESSWERFFFACLLTPLWEEFIYRAGPIEIVRYFKLDNLMWLVILTSSIIFGLGHNGIPSLLHQGVGGVLYSILYIRNGYSYWSCVILHSIWNLTLMLNIIDFQW